MQAGAWRARRPFILPALGITEEYVRIGGGSKQILLETFLRAASQGLLCAARAFVACACWEGVA
jgi:hypothetical protein